MDCSDFVRRFTDYRDGSAPPDDVRAMNQHLAGCMSCRRYESVVDHGATVLRSLPQPELREDFEPRLRHRLYHVEDERFDQAASGAPALTVLGIALVLTAVAWAPVLRGADTVVRVEPIVVDRAPSAPVRSAPPTVRPVGSQAPSELDGDLWDDTRFYDYSALSRRYQNPPRNRPVGLDQGR